MQRGAQKKFVQVPYVFFAHNSSKQFCVFFAHFLQWQVTKYTFLSIEWLTLAISSLC